MPFIQVTLPAGFQREEKAALFAGLTQAAMHTVDAPIGNVRIILHEVPLENFAHAGVGLDAQPLARLPEVPR
jgi:4-oxalocrotonate tautomerase family enzyme